MKIDDDHMFHGAALIQIAEHRQFTAINALKGKLASYDNVFRINSDIAVYFKYASKPNNAHQEYIFTFSAMHLAELDAISKAVTKTFLALVCVKAREICCLPYEQLLELIQRRRKDVGQNENQYTLLVTAKANESLPVYVNKSRTKNTKLGKDIIVNRNAFPNALFP